MLNESAYNPLCNGSEHFLQPPLCTRKGWLGSLRNNRDKMRTESGPMAMGKGSLWGCTPPELGAPPSRDRPAFARAWAGLPSAASRTSTPWHVFDSSPPAEQHAPRWETCGKVICSGSFVMYRRPGEEEKMASTVGAFFFWTVFWGSAIKDGCFCLFY